MSATVPAEVMARLQSYEAAARQWGWSCDQGTEDRAIADKEDLAAARIAVIAAIAKAIRDERALVLADPPDEAMVEKMARAMEPYAWSHSLGDTREQERAVRRARAAWTAVRKWMMEE